MQILVTKRDGSVRLPEYATEGAAGFDFFIDNFKRVINAGVPEPIVNEEGQLVESIKLYPGARVLVGTGLKVAIPLGYEIQVRPRSGLALKQGITVLNSPGTIDCDYRGEIGVIIINHSKDAVELKRGQAIAQGVLNQVDRAVWANAATLPDTPRGQGGFGSTTKQ